MLGKTQDLAPVDATVHVLGQLARIGLFAIHRATSQQQFECSAEVERLEASRSNCRRGGNRRHE
jgi:hypothetical protein